MDGSDEIVIKCQLGDEIRRMPIYNNELNFEELVIMLKRVFKAKLDDDAEFVIKCRDEDGDYITISEDAELSYALHGAKILRLKIFTQDEVPESTDLLSQKISFGARSAVVSELRRLRDYVTTLADKLDNLALCNGNSGSETPRAQKLAPIRPEFESINKAAMNRSETPESQSSLAVQPPTVESQSPTQRPPSSTGQAPQMNASSYRPSHSAAGPPGWNNQVQLPHQPQQQPQQQQVQPPHPLPPMHGQGLQPAPPSQPGMPPHPPQGQPSGYTPGPGQPPAQPGYLNMPPSSSSALMQPDTGMPLPPVQQQASQRPFLPPHQQYPPSSYAMPTSGPNLPPNRQTPSQLGGPPLPNLQQAMRPSMPPMAGGPPPPHMSSGHQGMPGGMSGPPPPQPGAPHPPQQLGGYPHMSNMAQPPQ